MKNFFMSTLTTLDLLVSKKRLTLRGVSTMLAKVAGSSDTFTELGYIENAVLSAESITDEDEAGRTHAQGFIVSLSFDQLQTAKQEHLALSPLLQNLLDIVLLFNVRQYGMAEDREERFPFGNQLLSADSTRKSGSSSDAYKLTEVMTVDKYSGLIDDRSFSVAAPAPLFIGDGAPLLATATVTRSSGFFGTIDWTVAGLPAGVTVAIGTESAGQLPLTFKAAPSFAGGAMISYSINGTSGTLSASASGSVEVADIDARYILREATTELVRQAGTYPIAVPGTVLELSDGNAYHTTPPGSLTAPQWAARKIALNMAVKAAKLSGSFGVHDVLNVIGFDLAVTAVNWVGRFLYGRNGVEADWGVGMLRLLKFDGANWVFNFNPTTAEFVPDEFFKGFALLNYNPRPDPTVTMSNGQNAVNYFGFATGAQSGGGNARNCLKDAFNNDNDSPNTAPGTDVDISVNFFIKGKPNPAIGEEQRPFFIYTADTDGGRSLLTDLVFYRRDAGTVDIGHNWGIRNSTPQGQPSTTDTGTDFVTLDGWQSLLTLEGNAGLSAVRPYRQKGTTIDGLALENGVGRAAAFATTVRYASFAPGLDAVIPNRNEALGGAAADGVVGGRMLIGYNTPSLEYKVVAFGGVNTRNAFAAVEAYMQATGAY